MTPNALVCWFGFHLVQLISLVQHLVTQQKRANERTESVTTSSGGTIISYEFEAWVKWQPKYALCV